MGAWGKRRPCLEGVPGGGAAAGEMTWEAGGRERGPGLLAAFPGEPLTCPSLHSPANCRPGGKVKINPGWWLAEFLFPVTQVPYHSGPVQWTAKDCF